MDFSRVFSRTGSATARLAVALALLSGMASLVDEVVWSRMLALLLGNTAGAHAVVLATFLGGLAIGYSVFGRTAERLRRLPGGAERSLRAFALLEGAIGLYAAVSPYLLDLGTKVFLAGARVSGADSVLVTPMAVAAAALLLLPPTVLMGGTLPLLIGAIAGGRPRIAGATARAYAANSAGAVLGSLAAGFFLIETIGHRGSLALAGAVDVVVAVVGVAGARAFAARQDEERQDDDRPLVGVAGARAFAARQDEERQDDDRPLVGVAGARAFAARGAAAEAGAVPAGGAKPALHPRWLPLTIAVTAGTAGLIFEVTWIRLFGLFFGSATQSFTIVVAAFILGIALGSAAVGWALRRGADGARLLAGVSLIGAATVLGSRFVAPLVPWAAGALRMHFAPLREVGSAMAETEAAFAWYQVARFGVAAALLLGPTFAAGMMLPLCTHLGETARNPTGVGRVLAWNTAGCVVAAAATSSLLVPAIGLRGCLLLVAGAYLAISILASRAAVRPRRLPATVALALAAAVAAIAVEQAAPWDPLHLSAGEFRRDRAATGLRAWLDEPLGAAVMRYEEGATATVATLVDTNGDHFLMIDGKSDASESGDALTQYGLGVLGAVAADRPRDALVIGFGSGATAGVMASVGLEVDVVEIEPAVIRAGAHFSKINLGALQSPRVHLHLADARAWLGAASRDWDVVVSEPSNPWVAGMASLYTREFFRIVRARLRPGGALVQWFHVYDMDDGSLQLILRTITDSFGWVSVWRMGDDVVLVARDTPGVFADLDALDRRIDVAPIKRTLQRGGVIGMAAFCSLNQAGNEGLRAALAAVPGPLHVDDLPILEHALPRAQFARRTARWLDAHDARGAGARDAGAAFRAWTTRHPPDAMEKVAVTLIQARQGSSPAAFRFQFLDEICARETEPDVLADIAVGLAYTGARAELDKTVAALRRRAPEHPLLRQLGP